MRDQAMCKPTDTGTDQTTGDSNPCNTYPKHHKICSSRTYTEIKKDNICSLEIK